MTAFVITAMFAVPSFGPFAAAGFLARSKWGAPDFLWLVSVVLLAIPSIASGDARLVGGIILAGLVYKAGEAARRILRPLPSDRYVLLGLLILHGIGWIQLLLLQQDRASGWPWIGDPNLYGHTLLASGGVAMIALPSPWIRVVITLLSVSGTIVTGSRSALFGIAVLLVLLTLIDRKRWPRRLLLAMTVFGVTVVLAVDAQATTRITRGLQLLMKLPQITPSLVAPTNLLYSSEDMDDSSRWQTLMVELEAFPSDDRHAVWMIRKSGTEDWARLQQTVQLEPRETYTFSGFIRSLDSTAHSGFLGWGRSADKTVSLQITFDGKSWSPSIQQKIQVDSFVGRLQSNGWSWIEVTFTYVGEERVAWAIGPTPDQRPIGSGAELLVRSLQLERGTTARHYQPTYAIGSGQGTILSRLPIWSAAISGFREAPLLGQGAAAYPSTYLASGFPVDLNGAVPRHAHNLWLQVLFSHGILGLAGTIVLVVALIAGPVRARAWDGIALIASLLAANLFDTTLFFGGVLYPLALGLGWISSRQPK